MLFCAYACTALHVVSHSVAHQQVHGRLIRTDVNVNNHCYELITSNYRHLLRLGLADEERGLFVTACLEQLYERTIANISTFNDCSPFRTPDARLVYEKFIKNIQAKVLLSKGEILDGLLRVNVSKVILVF